MHQEIRPQMAGLHQHLSLSDSMQSALLTKNWGKELSRSPSLTPTRAESGDRLDIQLYYTQRADKQNPPSLGLEPTRETEDRNTMFDMKKNPKS